MQESKNNPYKPPQHHVFNMGYATASNGFPQSTNPYKGRGALDWHARCWNEGWKAFFAELNLRDRNIREIRDKELLAIIDAWHNGKYPGYTMPEAMNMTDLQYSYWKEKYPLSKPPYVVTSIGQYPARIYRWPIRLGGSNGGN